MRYIALALLLLFPVKVEAIWTAATYSKLDRLVTIGIPKDIATSLITHCKATARDPVHCIKIGAMNLGAESSLGTRCKKNNNCVGMEDGHTSYKSKDAGIKDWVKRYNKWWYKQEDPSGFYRDDGTLPPTRYCMGKRKDGICKEGTANAWKVWNLLKDL